mgnify:CR=1 FL=1
MKALSSMGFALFGAALVAISYGLARFAFGLFVPSISAELSLTSYLVGIIGALPFSSLLGVPERSHDRCDAGAGEPRNAWAGQLDYECRY